MKNEFLPFGRTDMAAYASLRRVRSATSTGSAVLRLVFNTRVRAGFAVLILISNEDEYSFTVRASHLQPSRLVSIKTSASRQAFAAEVAPQIRPGAPTTV